MALAEAEVPVLTLEDYKTAINDEARRLQGHERDALESSIRIGHQLIAARKFMRKGEWDPWLRENIELPLSRCRLNVRFATFEAEIADCRGVQEARGVLKRRKDLRVRTLCLNDDMRADILRLRAAGKSYNEIARLADTYPSYVWSVCNPQRFNEREKERQARGRAERRALKRQQREAAIRKHGKDAWEIYEHLRKACEGIARLDRSDPEAKDLLDSAWRQIDIGGQKVWKALRIEGY